MEKIKNSEEKFSDKKNFVFPLALIQEKADKLEKFVLINNEKQHDKYSKRKNDINKIQSKETYTAAR